MKSFALSAIQREETMALALALEFPMGRWLAFALLSLLLLAAAVPLAIGWARLIPPDDPLERESSGPQDWPDAVLLFLVTLSYAVQLPGLPWDAARNWLVSQLPQPWPEEIVFIGGAVFILFPGLAAVYAAIRSRHAHSPLCWPVILAGLLVSLMWFAAPYLTARWLSY